MRSDSCLLHECQACRGRGVQPSARCGVSAKTTTLPTTQYRTHTRTGTRLFRATTTLDTDQEGDFAGLENSCNQHKSVELFERKVPKAYIKCIFIEMRPGLVHGPNLVTKPSESLCISLWSLIITSNLN